MVDYYHYGMNKLRKKCYTCIYIVFEKALNLIFHYFIAFLCSSLLQFIIIIIYFSSSFWFGVFSINSPKHDCVFVCNCMHRLHSNYHYYHVYIVCVYEYINSNFFAAKCATNPIWRRHRAPHSVDMFVRWSL